MDEIDVEFDDVLGAGACRCEHGQHVPHRLPGLGLDAVEQASGAIGSELAADIQCSASRCDHALHEGRVVVEFFRVEVHRLCGHHDSPSTASDSVWR
ncbi:hypothetical protein P9209_15670 [Prescottella defluvii]|nr:hypothetical protein P9209_15670 [Prescottella defluvii]